MIHVILQAAAFIASLTQPNGDAIPDFSRVGYHFGDREIPSVEVVKTLEAPADGSDATAMIQEAIDGMTAPGAILLKSGTYNIGETIRINRSGVVLRGEGEATKLVATKRKQYTLIRIGEKNLRELSDKRAMITPKYTPAGQMWVAVDSPKLFKAGDRVVIFRPGTSEWISDIRMDRIPNTSRTNTVKQWRPKEYNLYWERTVVDVKGKKVYLDNPVVMSLDSKYGGGELICCSMERITEVGVENMLLESEFDPELKDNKGRWIDEQHAWTGISVWSTEHGWIRNVTARHFGYALFTLSYGARNITAEGCKVEMPVSIVTGSRRYAFTINAGADLNLVKDCWCDNDRHGCVTGARVCGPNVYLDCKGTNMWSDFGPHHRWSTGVLYDRVTTDGTLNVQDRSSWGSGHGWAAGYFVLWNCEAKASACQNPWTSAVNWCVGLVGDIARYNKKDMVFENSTRSHPDGLQRPDCVRASQGKHVSEPASLYYYQLEKRHKAGIWLDR